MSARAAVQQTRSPAGPARWMTGLASLILSALLCSPPALAGQIAVRGEVVHTVAGPAIADGVVLIGADGRIEAVGLSGQVTIPPGYRVLSGRVVTPGLVDARSVVGLAGPLGMPHDQDQIETSNAIQPELRAFDAYNARDLLVEWVRVHGVTTVHTGHAPGALMSGQTMIVKPRGNTVGEAIVDSSTMVAMTLGPEVAQNFSGRPGTRARGVALVRQELIRAQEYAARRENASNGTPPARDLKLETLVRLLDGELRALVTAHRVPEILAALRLQREFGFDLVLDGAAESYLLIEDIRAAGVPVILHPPMARHAGALQNATFETARILSDAGIPVTIQSGYEPYVPKTRVLLFEAGPLVGYGFTMEEALSLVTIEAARILRLDHRVGSLEAGKDGDVAIFDGDPMEYTTRVCGVVIDGVVVSEECH